MTINHTITDHGHGASVSIPRDVKAMTVVRLQAHVYKALEDKFSKLVVTSNTTAHEAGYQLGVQAVLKELRTGYVVTE